MVKTEISIHWFRQDLRLSDNPGLTHAAKSAQVLPIFILDDGHAGENARGGASRWWLHHSLASLNKSLHGKLSLYQGNPLDILRDLIQRYGVTSVHWNRCYEPWRMERDAKIKAALTTEGTEVKSHNGSLLWEPWQIQKGDGTPYKVFTPFYRNGCMQAAPPRKPLAAPKNMHCVRDETAAQHLDQLALLPLIRWDKQLQPHWSIGERGAKKRFKSFLDKGIFEYKEGRNVPSQPFVSRISPHLHFGEISVNQLWYGASRLGDALNVNVFHKELAWREFSYGLLYHNPSLPKQNLQKKFDRFSWVNDQALLQAWQLGKTGVPMVDAGMRELWQTGYMHNRVRMIVGSYLVKNLRLHWNHGERWFWSTLVDADLANNSAGWQWIAGCGADAAPYFRIFNPVTQGKTHDPEGLYVRQYVPELALLPNKYLHCPWEAPEHVLQAAQVTLDVDYPYPIVDLKASRQAALAAFQILKQTPTTPQEDKTSDS